MSVLSGIFFDDFSHPFFSIQPTLFIEDDHSDGITSSCGSMARRPHQQSVTSRRHRHHALRLPEMEINVEEEDKQWIISAQVPNAKKEDYVINLLDNERVIELQAKTIQEHRQGDDNHSYYSKTEHVVSRRLPLPPDANDEAIEAKFVDGVLQIVVGKKEPVVEPAQPPKTIQIQ